MARLQRFAAPALTAIVIALAALPIGPARSQAATPDPRETAVAPEVNPPGDIPDDQVFITYTSPSGFSIEVPEGWSRTDRGDGATFADKYGSIDIAVEPDAAMPTLESLRASEVPRILAAGHAAEVTRTSETKMPVGTVFAIDYLSNSETNPVTDRRIRLENRRLYYVGGGRRIVVTLSAPAGADNVDQWKMMSESFRWTS